MKAAKGSAPQPLPYCDGTSDYTRALKEFKLNWMKYGHEWGGGGGGGGGGGCLGVGQISCSSIFELQKHL